MYSPVHFFLITLHSVKLKPADWPFWPSRRLELQQQKCLSTMLEPRYFLTTLLTDYFLISDSLMTKIAKNHRRLLGVYNFAKCTLHYITVQYSASTIQYSTSTIQYSTSTIQYSTVQSIYDENHRLRTEAEILNVLLPYLTG